MKRFSLLFGSLFLISLVLVPGVSAQEEPFDATGDPGVPGDVIRWQFGDPNLYPDSYIDWNKADQKFEFGGAEWGGLRLELTDNPGVCTAQNAGEMYFNTILDTIVVCDGENNIWSSLGSDGLTSAMGTASDSFILDDDDSGGDIALQFGTTLNERLSWNASQQYFFLSDDLVVDGNMNLFGTALRLDYDNAGSGEDIDILAEQGTDGDGILRYSAANDRWESSNDGGAFAPLVRVFSASHASLPDQGQLVVSHPADLNHLRTVQVKHFVQQPSTDNSLDFDAADEGAYLQENLAQTAFVGGTIRLEGSFSGSETNNVAQGATATASSSVRLAHDAFDGGNGSMWYTSNGQASGGWLQADLGSSLTINRASVRWFNNNGTYNCRDFEIQGSQTDGASYQTVYSGNTVSGGQEQVYTFAPGTYRYWRFVCVTPNNSNYYVIREARLFEAIASYPSGPVYVSTGSNSISTANWTGINQFLVQQTTPANTSLRYLVSFDARASWSYWDGAAWVGSSLDNLQSDGMSAATLESLSAGNWMAAGGINSSASQTLDIAVDLSTADSTQTPSLDGISIGYTTSGYWQTSPDGYEIREFDDTTLIINQTGSTQQITVDVLMP